MSQVLSSIQYICFGKTSGSNIGAPNLLIIPLSSEISDLCEIADLLLFFSYFASQNKEIKSGNYFFDVSCAN